MKKYLILLKVYLKDVFSPTVHVHYHNTSKAIDEADWIAIWNDFDKAFKDMDNIIKRMTKL